MIMFLTVKIQNKSLYTVGDNSVSLRRIWTKLGGKSSYNPPGASYTAQGPQTQPEIVKNLLFRNYKNFKTNTCISWIFP